LSQHCIFCRIVRGEIPSRIVYENESVVAFRDTDPRAPTHVLVVPRVHVGSVGELEDPAVAGHLVLAARRVAEATGIAESGYRLVLNTGADAGQSVHHIHLHVLGGRPMTWPPG
jgi:histidine triad (HIT) family protein